MDQSKAGDIVYISEIVHNILEMNGTLSLSQHKQFWANLSSSETSTCYFTVLIAKLIGIDSGDKTTTLTELVKKTILEGGNLESNSNNKSFNEDLGNTISLKNAILNTIYFLALFYRFNPDFNHLKTALSKWSQLTLMERSQLNLMEKTKIDPSDRIRLDFCDEVIRMLTVTSMETNDTIRIIDQCSNIDFTPGFDYSNEKFDAKTAVPSLLNYYLQSLLSKEQAGKLILETILLFLKHPLLTEKRMLSLLHMFKQYLIKTPRIPPELINSGLSIIKTYYMWPRPYGDVARDVLQLLTIEQKAPGTTLRQRLLEENPELIKGSSKNGKERTVHVLFDSSSVNAKTLAELLKNQAVPDLSVHQLQINLIANTISTCLNIDSFSICYENLTKEDAARFFESTFQILSEAVLMSQQDAEAYRVKELSALKDEITQVTEGANSASNFATTKPRSPVHPPLNFQLLPVTVDHSLSINDDAQNSKIKYPKRSSVDLFGSIMGQYAAFADSKNKPTVKLTVIGGDSLLHNLICSFVYLKASAPKSFDGMDFQFYIIPVEQCYFSSFLSKYDGWYGRHAASLARCILKSYPAISVPQTGSHSSFNNNLERDKSSSSVPSPTVQQKPTSWNSIDLVNQVNAQGKSSPANPVRSLRMKVGSGDSNSSIFNDIKRLYEEEGISPTPGLVLRAELQNYLREARWKLEVNIYQCESWGVDGTFISTIPFFQRADIGLRAYARHIQKSNDLPESSSITQIQQHKSFKFSPPTVAIKYIQMNVMGIPKQGVPIETKPYMAIALANIPISSSSSGANNNVAGMDRGVPPNPTKPFLEMSAIDLDPKKRKAKITEKELETLPISSYHVSMVDIECEEKKKEKGFFALLDNVLYGPFSRVKITPAQINEEILSIPFMTYYPLDLPS